MADGAGPGGDDSEEPDSGDGFGFSVFMFLTHASAAMGGTASALLVVFTPAVVTAVVGGRWLLVLASGVAALFVRHYALTRWWASRLPGLETYDEAEVEMLGWLRWIHFASLPAPTAIALGTLVASSEVWAGAVVAGLFCATYLFFRWRVRRD